jgi:hypothetical protein
VEKQAVTELAYLKPKPMRISFKKVPGSKRRRSLSVIGILEYWSTLAKKKDYMVHDKGIHEHFIKIVRG